MSSKVAFEFDPFELAGVEPPKSARERKQAMKEIQEYVVNEVLGFCADGNSPVAGGQWKRGLSKEYRARKEAEGGQGFADMTLSGDMLNDLECVSVDDTTLSLQISGENAPKADGHNNHSGDSKLPPREFIPKDKQTFKRSIITGIRQIAEDFSEE